MDRVVNIPFTASLTHSSQRLKDEHSRIRLALKYNSLEPQQASAVFAPPSEIVAETDGSNSLYLDEIIAAIVANKTVQLSGIYIYAPLGHFYHGAFYTIGFIGGKLSRNTAERVIEGITPKILEGELSIDGRAAYEIFYERTTIIHSIFKMSKL